MKTHRRPKAIRIIALAVFFCFVVFLALAMAFAAQHAQHGCTGAHCEICAVLHQTARGFLTLPAHLPFALPACFALFAGGALFGALLPRRATPVAQKVKLND